MMVEDMVIKMLKKGRAPAMAHVARTHRVNLDWLLERSFVDPCVLGRYIDTASQLADILTKPILADVLKRHLEVMGFSFPTT